MEDIIRNLFSSDEEALSIYVYSQAIGKFATVFKDITECKREEDEFRRSHHELEIRVQERTHVVKMTTASVMVALPENPNIQIPKYK